MAQPDRVGVHDNFLTNRRRACAFREIQRLAGAAIGAGPVRPRYFLPPMRMAFSINVRFIPVNLESRSRRSSA